MKDFSELLRVVSSHQDFCSPDLVEDVIAKQQALCQLREGESQKRIELRLVLIFLVRIARHNNSAGTDVQA